MDAFRARMRRPDGVSLAATSVLIAGLVSAIVLGNVVGPASGPGASDPRITMSPTSSIRVPASASPASPRPSASPRTTDLPNSAGWRPLEWSPDSSSLLLKRGAQFAVSIDHRAPAPLDARLAGWWPRSGRALWFVVPRPEGMHLLLRDYNGAPLVALARAPDIAAVSWTPDGQTIAVGTPDGVLVGSPAGRLERVTTTRAASVALSPDALWLAVIPRLPNRSGPLVLDLARRTALSDFLAVDPADAVAWSPTRATLAFTAGLTNDKALLLLTPAESRNPFLVVSGVDPVSLQWSRNGRSVMAVVGETGSRGNLLAVTPGTGEPQVRRLGIGPALGTAGPGVAVVVDDDGDLRGADLDGHAEAVTYATDVGSCAPVGSAAGEIAYCARDGTVRLVRP